MVVSLHRRAPGDGRRRLPPAARRAHRRGRQPALTRYNYTAANFNLINLADLERLSAARRELIDFVSRLSEQELRFTGAHEDVGDITLLDALQEILDQDRGNFRHVCQPIADYYEEAL